MDLALDSAALVVLADNILVPFAASAFYKLTSREGSMWIIRRLASTETQQKQAFTGILQAGFGELFGQPVRITRISIVAAYSDPRARFGACHCSI
jgi:hypothetical protein